MVGWHHWLDGREFKQAPGVGYGQGSLACCCPWGHKESYDWTDWNCLFSISFSPSQPLTLPGFIYSTLVIVLILILFFILEYHSSLSSSWNIIIALNYALFLLFYAILYTMGTYLSHICRRHSHWLLCSKYVSWSLCPWGDLTYTGSGDSPVTCFDQFCISTMSCQPIKSGHNLICSLITHLPFFVPLHRLCPLKDHLPLSYVIRSSPFKAWFRYHLFYDIFQVVSHWLLYVSTAGRTRIFSIILYMIADMCF